MRTFELMLGYTWWNIFCEVYKENRVYRSTRAVLFSSTHLSTRMELNLYTRVYTKSTLEYFSSK